MKITLAIVNSLLSVGVGMILLTDLLFGVERIQDVHILELSVYGVSLILLITSVIAGWIVSTKPSEMVSKTWKILAFASAPVFLLFIWIFVF